DLTVSGVALCLELRLGGRPAAGIAMGVQTYGGAAGEQDDLDRAGRPETQVDGRSGVTARTSLHGSFVDYFPEPRENLHFGGSIGLASNVLEHDLPSDSSMDDAGGLGASAWVGYGWWVSKNWSLGGMLQVMGSFGESSGGDMSAR